MRPANAIMWQHLANRNQMKELLPVFDTSVELISKSLMQGHDIVEFHKAVTEQEPFGVFRKNWDLGSIQMLEILGPPLAETSIASAGRVSWP